MPEIVFVAVGCVAVWSGALLQLRLRKPRWTAVDIATAAGPVPEAVRAVLAAGSDREDPAILNAAIRELAEAGVLYVEPADSQHPALVHPAAVPDAGALPEYQASVVARLLHRRGASRTPVPLTALQPSEDPTARVWNREFYRQVRREATARGLLQSPFGQRQFWPMAAAGVVTSGFCAGAISHYWRPQTAIPDVAFILLALLSFGALQWAAKARPTREGRAIALAARSDARMLRQLRQNQTQTQNQTPTQESPQNFGGTRVLSNQLQPLPANQVWSSYGGTWHPLDVNTRETYSIGSGGAPIVLLLVLALVSLGGASASLHIGDRTNAAAIAVFVGLPVVVVLGVVGSALRRRRLPKRAVLRGQVAKLWSIKRDNPDGGSNTHYYCTLDVGRAPESVRLRLGSAMYQRLQVGDEVDVLVNPRRKRIKDLRFVLRSDL